MRDFDNIPQNIFDRKRNEFLVAIYDGDFQAVLNVYNEILEKFNGLREPGEEDLKALYQIQHAFRVFRRRVPEPLMLELRNLYTCIRKKLTRITRDQTRDVSHIDYEAWAFGTGLSEKLLSVLFQTVTSLQMSVGCSNTCRRCNEWALPGVRKHFSFDAVTTLIQKIFQTGNRNFALYSASDPLDWQDKEKTVAHIWKFMAVHGYHPRYGLLTKIPKGSEKTIAVLLGDKADIGFSITSKNREKAQKIETTLQKKLEWQHDFDDLLIPAGRDDDFLTIKPSVVDSYGAEITPEGVFMVIPTFTSALYPTGQCRIRVTSHMGFCLKQKVGRAALPVAYFKPLEAVDRDGRIFTLDHLLDAQIENILLDTGDEGVSPPGMMNLREYFQTFAPAAVQQRRLLLPAVIKGLQKEILRQEKYKEENKKERCRHFRQQVRGYMSFCSKMDIGMHRKNAFDDFLKTIADYLKSHPVERRIISKLREKDRPQYVKKHPEIFMKDVPNMDHLLNENEKDLFSLFEAMLFRLLDDPKGSEE